MEKIRVKSVWKESLESLANILVRWQRVLFDSGDFGENDEFGKHSPKSYQKVK